MEAERAAKIRLGGVAQVKEAYRDQWGIPALESQIKDVAFAVRSLRRDPGFTIAALLALTLGVAFTISIFTVVNGVLINPLDFPDPENVVIFLRNTPYGELSLVSYPNYQDWRKQQRSFVDLAVYHYTEFNLAGAKNALRVLGYQVTPGFFTVLGIKPLFGLAFPAEAKDGSKLAVLSYNTWQKAFGGDRGVIGRTIQLNDKPYQITAVMPPGKPAHPESDIFVILDPETDRRFIQMRTSSMFEFIGRVRPGVTHREAQTEMDVISRRLELAYPEAREHLYVKLKPWQEDLVGETRTRLWCLMGAVLFVLLIACLNTASLLLTRGSLRAREVALRIAMGATRARVIRQFLVESLVLALGGSLLGLLITRFSIGFLQSSFPHSVPRLKEAGLDSHVLAFALIVAVVSALVFGLVPALRDSRTNLNTALKEGTSGSTHTSGSLRLRSGMVIAQVALSAVLVVGAGLLVKSYWLLTGVELGFKTEGLITAQTVLSPGRYKTAADQIRFVFEAEERLRKLPGVDSVGAANNLTFSNWAFVMSGNFDYETSNGEKKQTAALRASFRCVSPGFLEALGISRLYGRSFNDRDTASAAPVVIVDRTFARNVFPDGQALNRRITLEKQWKTIVGVVDSIRESGPLDKPTAAIYIPFDQAPGDRVGWVIKTQLPARAMIPQVRRVLADIDRDQPVYSVRAMRDAFSESVVADRLNASLMFVFAAAALALAALGLYGVLAYHVASRTREIGIRMAVGAHRAQVFQQIAAGGLKLVIAGLCLGFLAAAGLTRLLSGMLYAVRPLDWSVFVIVAALLLLVGFAALSIPAWNASRLSPSQSLRWE